MDNSTKSRSEWYRSKVEEFVKSSDEDFPILLYTKEITAVKRWIKSRTDLLLGVEVGSQLSNEDTRKFVRIIKKGSSR